jgi:hypothetical protein
VGQEKAHFCPFGESVTTGWWADHERLRFRVIGETEVAAWDPESVGDTAEDVVGRHSTSPQDFVDLWRRESCEAGDPSLGNAVLLELPEYLGDVTPGERATHG